MSILLALFVLLPTDVLGFVSHDYPAIYTHQLGNLFYLVACGAFLWTVLHNQLRSQPGWRYIFWAVLLFLFWDGIVVISRVLELLANDEFSALRENSLSGWSYFHQKIRVDGVGYLVYAGRFDFLMLNSAMFLYFRGLKEHLDQIEPKRAELSLPAAAVLPMFPIFLSDIIGNIVFFVLAVLCLRTSLQLFHQERENILWSYFVWLSSAFLLFSVSRSFGHISRHFLLAAELDAFWRYLDGISGSLNTAVRFIVASLTLFFAWIYQIYLKMSDDKQKIVAVSADIMNLNQELEELGAERTFALLGLRIADNIRNPVAIIGCVSQRLLRRREFSDHHREDIEDVLSACRKLENIVSDFESIIRNKPHMFRYEDVNGVVQDIVDLMKSETEKRGIRLITEFSSVPAKINLQRNLMRVGLFYLMRNAVNATSAGGAVTVSTFVTDEVVTIRIADTGCGIPEEVLQRLFDPLYSQSGERLRMALPLVRQIVTEHLGELVVNSEVGKGTTFDMIFPVKWCLISTQMGR